MLTRRVLAGVAVLAFSFAAPALARAQLSITPLVGGYVVGSSVSQVTTAAQTMARTRDGTLSLGADLDLGMLRGTLAYASGTTIENANRQNVGKGTMIATAADLVIRPIPRIFVQPYLVAGAGEKFYRYDQTTSFTTNATQRAFALHGGVGADAMFGPIGVVAELTDFASKDAAQSWGIHDAFLMVGLKLKLGQ